MNIKFEKYRSSEKDLWDKFVDNAKNGLFLFKRNYMEYHSDRFKDFSLVIYCDNQVAALLPAHVRDDVLYSHNGLTYGGILYGNDLSAGTTLQIFEALKTFLVSQGIKRFFYKSVPHIFHKTPAEEDLYALFRTGAALYRVDLSSTMDLKNLIGFSRGKNSGLKKAKSSNLEIEISQDFECFFNEIVAPVLNQKYELTPVHTAQEMRLLQSKFPAEIVLYVVKEEGVIVAGSLLYLFETVVHLQYMFSNSRGQKIRASELLLDFLIGKFKAEKKYLNFGISTQNDGTFLNLGLLNYKEEFGARATVNNHYVIEL